MYLYKQTEFAGRDGATNNLFTVGYYEPKEVNGMGMQWIPESDHGTAEEAAKRVHYLNGGKDTKYKCRKCSYESEIENKDKWEGMCNQCWMGKYEFGMEY